MTALTEDPSTNAPAVGRGTDGPASDAVSRSHLSSGADGATSRPVEGSSVSAAPLAPVDIKLASRVLLRLEGIRLTARLYPKKRPLHFSIFASADVADCWLYACKGDSHIFVGNTYFALTDVDVVRLRKAYESLGIRITRPKNPADLQKGLK